jgi:hypothetical protein
MTFCRPRQGGWCCGRSSLRSNAAGNRWPCRAAAASGQATAARCVRSRFHRRAGSATAGCRSGRGRSSSVRCGHSKSCDLPFFKGWSLKSNLPKRFGDQPDCLPRFRRQSVPGLFHCLYCIYETAWVKGCSKDFRRYNSRYGQENRTPHARP